MCQMNVVLEHDGQQEKVMDNVTSLEVTGFFEEPKLVEAARVKSIDFLGGTVTLQENLTTEEK